jgi:hypothetical protein
VVERTLASMSLDGAAPPVGLRLALRGWVAFIDEVSLAWLEHPTLALEDLREMLVHQLVAIVTASARTDAL